jgi:hypothetical protein
VSLAAQRHVRRARSDRGRRTRGHSHRHPGPGSRPLPDGSSYDNVFMQNMRMRWARIAEIHTLEDTVVLQQALDRIPAAGIAEAHAEPIVDHPAEPCPLT